MQNIDKYEKNLIEKTKILKKCQNEKRLKSC